MIQNPHRDKASFIVISGLNGVGKTTQVQLLATWLKAQGHEITLTKEPTDQSQAGKRIRRILQRQEEKPSSEELQRFFATDRHWDDNNVIRPALVRGEIVISDRHKESSQCFGQADGVSGKFIEELNKDFVRPDLTIILSLPFDVLEERLRSRRSAEGRERELFHEIAFLKKVWAYYAKYPEEHPDENICMVDGAGFPEAVHQRIQQLVRSLLPKK